MTTTTTALTAARAEALFTSHLSTGSHPAHDVVEQAIRTAVRTHGGVRGCAADVATEYGDHPDVAVPRMRWARGVIDDLYARSRPTHPRDGWAQPRDGWSPGPAQRPGGTSSRPADPAASTEPAGRAAAAYSARSFS
jgi:hypothetical protein